MDSSGWDGFQPPQQSLDVWNRPLTDQSPIDQQARYGIQSDVMADDFFIIHSFHLHIRPPRTRNGFRKTHFQFQAVVTACAQYLDLHINLLLSGSMVSVEAESPRTFADRSTIATN